MTKVLLLKTAALGDVLRTTSVLPGLAERYPDLELTWVTAKEALPLVAGHRLVRAAHGIDLRRPESWRSVEAELALVRWDWLLSFDDEPELCRMASRLSCERLSGAYVDETGARRYTPDVAPWFDMGLLSVHGKERADQLKLENQRSHPEIFAAMLGVAMGRPELELDAAAREQGRAFAERAGLGSLATCIGLNTGAGGRWPSKELSIERTIALARLLERKLGAGTGFLVLGGQAEGRRNAELVAGLRAELGTARVLDAGTENGLLEFAAIVSLCDLIVTSDSLALHVALARGRRTVVFFAPTSAAEIELYGLGEKVVSTAPDYCSYRPDADNRSITPERVAEACLRVLAQGRSSAAEWRRGRRSGKHAGVSARPVYVLGKLLQGLGLLVVLVGVAISMSLGFGDEGLASMRAEFQGLAVGGGLFLLGWLLERWSARG